MRVRVISIAAGTVALLGAGCGDSEKTTPDNAAGTSGQASCLESFTSSAPQTLSSLARLSHAQGSPVTIGTYAGSVFSAETYDEGTEGDGREIAVARGACVITEVSRNFGPLYIFVQADDGGWHRLLESDPAVPLVPNPERQLDHVENVEIEQIGA
jgi:hypothetical protein